MLLHSIDALARVNNLQRIFVLLAADDRYWRETCDDVVALGMPDNGKPGSGKLDDGMRDKITALYCGGATRAATVRNGLQQIAEQVAADDWILVHDAARPCVDPRRIEAMMALLEDDLVGGLLALRVPDTIKRGSGDKVVETISREGLWLAQTPQMFRYALLRTALAALPEGAITDESQAVEALGLAPRLVVGDASNLKVTYAEDVALAEAILLRFQRHLMS